VAPRRARSATIVALAATLALWLAGAAPASADAGSLYAGPGPRPGPDLLYAAPATPPQLQNTGIWQAPPILVSGASAYRNGEFLYQDFIYDDHGAAEARDSADPRFPGNLFSQPNGTYTYPTGPAYANNAADLVEFRVKPLSDATAFRITLNTMKDPSLVAVSIAIGGTPGVSLPFPDGANVSAPADLFLTIHPSGPSMVGDLVHSATGTPVAGPAPTVTVDTFRRQIDVRVPHADWNPAGQVVRLAAGVGLWDKPNNRYLIPQGTSDTTHPGGAGNAVSPPAFFNVAFRNDEPMPSIKDPFNTAQSPAWWRDKEQGQQLAAGDISNLHADVDFSKLAAGVNDDSAVPQNGPFDRILASRFETAQGADFSAPCLTSGTATCKGEYQGQLQPYAIYVPRKPAPFAGYGMTLLLHSLTTDYNQYLASRNQAEFGERGPGSIVITPESRGPDGSYVSYAAADVFEVWADVARAYHLDPAWTVITGYSMGGFGTFDLGEQFPDLFARGQPTVGASTNNAKVASLRNIPFLMWNMATDELVPESSYLPSAQQLDSLGYRYELDVFSPGEHNSLAINDEFAPAAAFLGTAKVDRDPAHVTYVYDPSVDYPALGMISDHAYWLSGLKLRGPGGQSGTPSTGRAQTNGPLGTVDARSEGFGVGDPTPSPTQHGSGTLTGGTVPAIGYTSQYRTWGPTPVTARADRIDITAQNLATLTINVARAHVDCNVALNVNTDGPMQIRLDGCGTTQSFGPHGAQGPRACSSARTLVIRPRHARGARVRRVSVFVNGRRTRTLHARGRRGIARVTVSLTALVAQTVHVKLRMRVSSRGRVRTRIDRRTYRTCAATRRRRVMRGRHGRHGRHGPRGRRAS
jgi:hypothetical protein